jgi:hypothetical protein
VCLPFGPFGAIWNATYLSKVRSARLAVRYLCNLGSSNEHELESRGEKYNSNTL